VRVRVEIYAALTRVTLALMRVPVIRWPAALFGVWLTGRLVRLILRHGSVRHLNALHDVFRTMDDTGEIERAMTDVMPDKARYVLERDSAVWRP
jgi:hypothetical protein